MKKNEKKWIIVAIILLAIMLSGRILSIGGSAKEEIKDEPKEERCMTYYTLNDNDTFVSAMEEIGNIVSENHENGTLKSIEFHDDYFKVEFDFEDHGGAVIARYP